MIPFDWRSFSKVLWLTLFHPKEADIHINLWMRLRFTFILLVVLLLETINTLSLLLDLILFPNHRQQTISRPLFIIGNPRSGTTFLHRLMAKDEEKFFVFRTWEMLFPSILQRRVFSLFGRIDRAIGSPIRNTIRRGEKRMLGRFLDLHPTGFFEPEEDEMLFIHCFSSIYLLFLFPFHRTFKSFFNFDQEVPKQQRDKLFSFYRRCVLRRAYCSKGRRTLLSKNPMFSVKVKTLKEQFPDARFIYLVRNPLETVPSTLSEGFATCTYSKMSDQPSREFQELVYGLVKTFYRYPLEILTAEGSPQNYLTVNFHNLVQNPKDTVNSIYQHFGLEMTEKYADLLDLEDKRSKSYRSKHRYSVDHYVISKERIRRELMDVFTRFGFSQPGGAEVKKI